MGSAASTHPNASKGRAGGGATGPRSPGRKVSGAGSDAATMLAQLQEELKVANSALANLTVGHNQALDKNATLEREQKVLKDSLRKHRHEVDKLRCLAEQHRNSTISDPADFVSIRSGSINSTDSANSRDSGNIPDLPLPSRSTSTNVSCDPEQLLGLGLAVPEEPRLSGLSTVNEEPSAMALGRVRSASSFQVDDAKNSLQAIKIIKASTNHRIGVSAPPVHEQELLLSKHQSQMATMDDVTVKSIMGALDGNPFTSKFDNQQQMALARAMRSVDVVAGAVVMRQGEQGDRLYVTESGLYDMSQNGEIKGVPIGAFQVIGEMAILYKCNRTATITTIRGGRLWFIDQVDFRMVLYQDQQIRHRERLEFLRTVDLFEGMTDDYMHKILDTLEESTFEKGDIVLDPSIDAEHFYFVLEGEILVIQTDDERQLPVRTLYRGCHFGETALMGTLDATCKAFSETVKVLRMDRLAFDELIVPLEALGRLKFEHFFGQQPAEDLATNKYCELKLEDLTHLGTLGAGGFGQVDMVLTPNKEKLALKMLSKARIVQHSQVDHVISEKNVLQQLNNPFCISMCATFKDDRFIYLLMHACLGGELWSHLREKGRLDDNATRFYSASVIEGISYLHGMELVYRDLKPENLMLTLTGYIKIVDFGFAKTLGHNEKTWTFCGTPDYMAPEIVLNQGHDRSADLWAIGVLIYELLVGKPPFFCHESMDTYNLIIAGIGSVKFPRCISESARKLIEGLCNEHPAERLGMLHDGMHGIRAQPWFHGFHWPSLHRQQMAAPFLPKVSDKEMSASTMPESEFVGTTDWEFEF